MTAKALRQSLPLTLHAAGAVKVDTKVGFKLKLHETKPEAPLSPIYLNLRTPDNPKPGPLTPEIVAEIGYVMWRYARKSGIKFDAVAGLPNAGTPLANAFAEALYNDGSGVVPLVKLNKTVGETSRKIEGVLDTGLAPAGGVVLVIDDLITRGDSKKEGIEALQKAGFKVTDVLVLVDREQGGKADLEKMGIRLWSLLTLTNLVNRLSDSGKINSTDKDKVLAYLASS